MDREKELIMEIYMAKELHKKKSRKRTIISLLIFGLFLLASRYFSGDYYFYTYKDILNNLIAVFFMVFVFFVADRLFFSYARKRDIAEQAYITMLELELEQYRLNK